MSLGAFHNQILLGGFQKIANILLHRKRTPKKDIRSPPLQHSTQPCVSHCASARAAVIMPNAHIPTLIVDDHPLIREAVHALLISLPQDYECTFSSTASETLNSVKQRPPKLIVCDLTLPDVDGVSLIRQLRQLSSEWKIIVYSMHDELLFGTRCIRSGANGYVMKEAPIRELRSAIDTVMEGKVHASQQLAQRLMSTLHNREGAQADASSLTDREFDIFHLIGRGLTTREIAEQLERSIKTIETHRENIKAKLELANATELLLAARDHIKREKTATSEPSKAAEPEVTGRAMLLEHFRPEDFFELDE